MTTHPERWTLLVVAGSLSLYAWTLAPDLLWGGGDFATYQRRAYLNEVFGAGDVFDHPLWVILAHPLTTVPVRSPAWRANFASALFASLALGFVYLAACRLTQSIIAAMLSAAALAVSHTFWTYAVMPKVYSLNALLLAACVYLLLSWRQRGHSLCLYLCAFCYGLSFLNHLVMATAALGIAALVLAEYSRTQAADMRSTLTIAALCFAIGFAPSLALSLAKGAAGSNSQHVLGFLGAVRHAARPRALLQGLGWGLVLGVYQFPVTFVVGLLGLYRLWRHDRTAALLIGLVIAGTTLFMLAATDPTVGGPYVWNLHYYLQAYVVFAVAMAVGFQELWARLSRRHQRAGLIAVSVLLPIVLYAAAPVLARRALSRVPDFRPLAGRDNFAYVLSPWKQSEDGARQFGRAVLSALPPNGVLFADYSIWAVIRYLQDVEGQRSDIELVELHGQATQVSTILSYRDRRPLFLADTYRYYDLDGIRRHFQIVPTGPIYRLRPRP